MVKGRYPIFLSCRLFWLSRGFSYSKSKERAHLGERNNATTRPCPRPSPGVLRIQNVHRIVAQTLRVRVGRHTRSPLLRSGECSLLISIGASGDAFYRASCCLTAYIKKYNLELAYTAYASMSTGRGQGQGRGRGEGPLRNNTNNKQENSGSGNHSAGAWKRLNQVSKPLASRYSCLPLSPPRTGFHTNPTARHKSL